MKRKLLVSALGIVLAASAVGPYNVLAAPSPAQWTNVNTYEEAEAEKSLFNNEHYSFKKYSELKSALQDIDQRSDRVKLSVDGKSTQGRDMFVVTISDTTVKDKLGYYQELRKKMFKNVETGQQFVDKNPDLKVPVLINASIHGTEFVGTDAVLQLINRFAFENDAVTKKVLENTILIINVDANPDGRVNATRFNGNGIDLNRDFITQSQPETRQMVGLMTKWNPLVMLDLHGYVKDPANNMLGLIEPCTPPHNPNYEYDLFSKWAMNQAVAMENEIVANKRQYPTLNSISYENIKGVNIPQRDMIDGWDDYPPIFTGMYAMYHGAYGYTLEAPTNDENGVRWHYDAMMGALKYTADNKAAMVKDQIEIFKRGITFDHPTHQAGFFPKAYVLPVNQADPTTTIAAVNHLLRNDVAVEKLTKAAVIDGKSYPAGTYIVKMNQAKAGLANTMLWKGEDITNQISAMYDISAWSLPQLWGFEATATQNDVNAASTAVKGEERLSGKAEGEGPFKILNSSSQAVTLVNKLLAVNIPVLRDGDGNFYVKAKKSTIQPLAASSGITMATASVPVNAKPLVQKKVAILKDGGLNKQQSHAGANLALKQMGFQVKEVTPQEVATKGLNGYDVFIYNGSESLVSVQTRLANAPFALADAAQITQFKQNVEQFLARGGKYVGVGRGASRATQRLGLTSVTVQSGAADSNGIVKVSYNPLSNIGDGFQSVDYGFVYGPTWYTNTGNVEVAATYENAEGFFAAGHWANRGSAKGQAVIVKEKSKDLTLIGLEPAFRDHTMHSFRLLSNTIFE